MNHGRCGPGDDGDDKEPDQLRSGLEYRIAANLRARRIPYSYEPLSISYVSTVSGGHCSACGSADVHQRRSYTPDFRFTNGVYVEAKGKLTSENRSSLRAFVASNPAIDLRFLFQRNNKYGSAGRRYTDWATSIGCYSAVGEVIPDSWYNDTPETLQVRKEKLKCAYTETVSRSAIKAVRAKGSKDSGKRVRSASGTEKHQRAARSSRQSRSARRRGAQRASRAEG